MKCLKDFLSYGVDAKDERIIRYLTILEALTDFFVNREDKRFVVQVRR